MRVDTACNSGLGCDGFSRIGAPAHRQPKVYHFWRGLQLGIFWRAATGLRALGVVRANTKHAQLTLLLGGSLTSQGALYVLRVLGERLLDRLTRLPE